MRHLAGGLEDASLWEPIDRAAAALGPIEELTQKHRQRVRRRRRTPRRRPPPAIRSLAFVDATAHHGQYDKTQLLLMGQERASLAMVLDLDTLTVAAPYGSGVSFLDVLELSGGMPTLVSIPKKRLHDTLQRLGVAEGDVARLAG